MMRRAFLFLVALAALACFVDCHGSRVTDAAPAVVQGSCIMLRAFTDRGDVHEVCTTLEELAPIVAPFVDDLIAERKDAREQGARVAFALPAAAASPRTRKPPRRRCVAWQYLDGGAIVPVGVDLADLVDEAIDAARSDPIDARASSEVDGGR